MKLYLWLNPKGEGAVHGVDYKKGLVDQNGNVIRECGRTHEFATRECKPIVYTERDLEGQSKEDYVEIVPFHAGNEFGDVELVFVGDKSEDSPGN